VARLFINYRQINGGWAFALDEYLSGRFGHEQVFRDARSIPAGADYVRALLEEVRKASILLVVIGPGWIEATNPQGRRKIEDESDWVRRELVEAFTYGVTVVPILVGGAPSPQESELPSAVAALARCQYLALPARAVSADLTRLGDGLLERMPGLREHERAGAVVSRGMSRPDESAFLAVEPAEQRRLVDAFAEVEGLHDAGSLGFYLDVTADALWEPLPLPPEAEEPHLVGLRWLVDALLQRPVALWTFLDIVALMHRGETDVTAVLRRLAESLVPRPLLTLTERATLQRMIGTIEYDGVLEIYRRAFRSGGLLPPPGEVSLRRALDHLEQMLWTPSFFPPILLFLEHFAMELDTVTAEALRYWIDQVAGRLELDPGLLGRMRSAASSTMTERKYLVIQVKPDGPDPGSYLLSVWLQADGGDGRTLALRDDPLSLAQVRDEVDDLLSSPVALGLVGGKEELMVEFVLPRELVDHEVERWRFGKPGLSRQLGIEFPVVVRSLERLADQTLHRRWQRNWQELQTLDGQPADEVMCWLRPDGRSSDDLLSELIGSSRPCLAVAYPSASPGHRGEDDGYTAMLLSGTPVAVWSRDRRDPDTFENEIQALLDGTSILALREQTLLLRQNAVRRAGEDGSPLGHHLTLLWDDPDRLPSPYVPLRAPA
jgi:vWA-MoxR associated protein C-terminal domain/vWA-MoxR associated protein middle region 0/TIR domain